MKRFVLAGLILLFSFVGAEAKTRHHHHKVVQAASNCIVTNDIMNPCQNWFGLFQHPEPIRVLKSARPRNEQTRPTGYYSPPSDRWGVSTNTRIVEHPAGCPHTAFCGCGASVEIFGHPVRALYLARNWYMFPRAMPAPNTVAVRRHHVFVLKQHIEGDKWVVFDANSGHHLTRVHERSIAGYTIVKPM